MKDTRPIEQQVAELTEEQKKTILKVDKYGMIVLLVLTVPGLLVMLLGLFTMMSTHGSARQDAYTGFLISGAIIVLISISMFLFIRIKFPYYSDQKCTYLRKQKKLEKKEQKQ
ncbi:MAG: hypothetical protein E7466_04280 [Ruminococcaceae bacterium]|nr:hypothetical protein [Oscillospiraceae bacterium]